MSSYRRIKWKGIRGSTGGLFPPRTYREYFVDATNGNDANPGTSRAQAWQSIAKVNGEAFRPTDRILFKRGETWQERLVVSSSGMAGTPIVFGAYGTGALPALDTSVQVTGWTDTGGNVWWATHSVDPSSCVKVNDVPGNMEAVLGGVDTAGDFYWDGGTNRLYVYSVGEPSDVRAANLSVGVGQGLIHSDSNSYVIFRDIALAYSTYHGIGSWNGQDVVVENLSLDLIYGMGILLDTCSQSAVRGCIVKDYGHEHWGKGIDCSTTSNSTVLNNVVYGTVNGPTASEGIGIGGGSSDIIVAHNTVYDIANIGIYIDSFDAAQSDILVDSNLVHDINETGMAHACEGGFANDNVTFSNNIVHTCFRAGILTGNWPAVAASDNVKIINNTVYNCGANGGWLDGGIGLLNNLITNMVCRNNICYDNDQYQIANFIPAYSPTVDYNLIWPFVGHLREIKGTDFVEADPLLVNPAAGNFHLQSGSPARGAGSATAAPDDDYDGVARGDPPDIGAYEYVA